MKKFSWIKAGLLAIFILAASGCGEQSEQQANERPPVPDQDRGPVNFKLLDKFDIGENIYARSILAAGDTLWVGTSAGLMEISLVEYVPRKIYVRDDGLANEYVFAVGKDRDGDIWLGTNGGGASRISDGDIKTFFPANGLADYWVYAFAQQQSGDLWIGTWAGANRYDPEEESFETYVDELINEWVYGIGIDARDRVWFGTEGGMTMFDGDAWHHWTHEDGLGAGNVMNLPPSDNTGLGTRNRHDLSVMVGTGESYNPNYIFAVIVDGNDHVWAGTWGGGVSRFDGQEWTSWSTADGLPGNIVYSAMLDRDGDYWFGTNRGLVHYNGKQWIHLGHMMGVPESDVYGITQDRNGHVWAAYKGAVLRFEKTFSGTDDA